MTVSTMTFSIMGLNFDTQDCVTLRKIFIKCFAECRYAECHYAECHYAECHYAECHYAEYHYSECHYSECLYSEYIYAESRGAVIKCFITSSQIKIFYDKSCFYFSKQFSPGTKWQPDSNP
jgi:hypothetical protein